MRCDRLAIRGFGSFRNHAAVDFTNIQGPIVAITGPNGSGKTTLLELLFGSMFRSCPTRGRLSDLATTRDSFVEAEVVNGRRWIIRQTVDAVSGKAEALVLDEDGRPVLPDAKVRSYDAWASKHLPSPEVLLASTFMAQGGQGNFLELSAAARKSVLLRTLGIERLELLAERARERARAAKAAADVLTARIGDEQERLLSLSEFVKDRKREVPFEALQIQRDRESALKGSLVAFEQALSEAREFATKADADIVAARDAYRQAEVEASDAAEAARKHRQRMAEAQALRLKASDLEAKATEIARRLDENRAILADAESIRGAVARIAEIDARLAELGAEIARLEGDERAEAEKAKEHESAARSLRDKASEVETKIGDLERRLANNKAVLRDAERIRSAVARVAEIEARLAEIATTIARLEGDERAELAKVRELETAAQRAREAAKAAEERRQRAATRAADREIVEAAVESLPALRSNAAFHAEQIERLRKEIRELDSLMLSGAERRIDGLRGGLTTIANGHGDAHDVAVGTLTADDKLAEEATEAPSRKSQAETELAGHQTALRVADQKLRDAEALAARMPEIEAAAKDAAAAATESDEHLAEAKRHEAAIAEPRVRSVEIRKEVETLRTEGTELRDERDRLAPLASKAAPLAQADARIAELEPQLADGRAEVERLGKDAERHDTEAGKHRARADELSRELLSVRGDRSDLQDEKVRLAPTARRSSELEQAGAIVAELEPRLAETRAEAERLRAQADEVAPKGDAPTTPDLAAAQRRVDDAERVARDAHGRVAVVERTISDARESAERLAGLEKERQAKLDDLADWLLLAESLGRDGLQALEIDAAGPELTELVNDLLRTCVGSRWTVSIETTKLSADGKRQLEGCEVRVLDTERGRDGTAESLSGGERVLVGEAVSLALSMLACRRSGVQGPTLVRDESGAALDPVNARGYVAMLRRAAEIVGARHVLFVSHSPEVQELADSRIVVADGKVRVAA